MAIFFLNTPTIAHGSSKLSCSANQVQMTTDVAALDATTFCSDGWTETVAGLKSASVTVGGFWETTSIDGQLSSQLGSSAPTTVAPDHDENGVAYLHQGLISSHGRGGSVSELAGRDLTLMGTGQLVRGVLLEPGTTNRTTSSNGTGVQQGSISASQTGYAALHVVESDDTGTLDVKIVSDDNSGFTTGADRITFTQATGVTSQWSSVAGAVADDYWRVEWTVAGGGTWKFIVSFGIAAN